MQSPADLEALIEQAVERRVNERLAELETRFDDALQRLKKVESSVQLDRVTMLVFSGEFDALMSAFTIAAGAVAMGMEVSMYFTFWGLAGIKKDSVYKGKPLAEKMITGMLPTHAEATPTTRMNMMGIGPKFFQWQMRNKNVETLPDMINIARELGVKMIGCQMAMDVMGVTKEELIDGIEFGGVATYVAEAIDSKVTLFI